MAVAGNTGEHLRIPGLVAVGDLSAKRYHIVMLATTAKQVKVSTGPTAANIGILQNDPKTQEAASVCGAGLTKGVAGGTIAVGDMITAKTTGQCAATTTANNKVIGKAITAAVAADLFEVFLAPSNY